MWNRQTFIQWALGLLLTASVSLGIVVWQNYKGKLDAATEKIDALKSEREDLRLSLAKCEIGHDNLVSENEDLKDRNRSLERQIRWRR
jgi:chromosome segregation ATPase